MLLQLVVTLLGAVFQCILTKAGKLALKYELLVFGHLIELWLLSASCCELVSVLLHGLLLDDQLSKGTLTFAYAVHGLLIHSLVEAIRSFDQATQLLLNKVLELGFLRCLDGLTGGLLIWLK